MEPAYIYHAKRKLVVRELSWEEAENILQASDKVKEHLGYQIHEVDPRSWLERYARLYHATIGSWPEV